ncbi:MAG: hypothetical protein QM572_01415 [Nocardioides sp.]|uniref:hypothetical protein n=1 Tax=Nocardioides sp. TaxID=35761 RepID=UPI0039E6791E
MQLSRPHLAALARIGFGMLWAIDASFKWMPGFIGGHTLADQFAKATTIHTPVVHQMLELNKAFAAADAQAFAVTIAVVETIVAIMLILGVASRAAFIGSALLSLGIWIGAEGMHLPWYSPGQTDLGPSAGYVFASLALLASDAGSRWSVDALRRR